jgi:hypothetical protein
LCFPNLNNGPGITIEHLFSDVQKLRRLMMLPARLQERVIQVGNDVEYAAAIWTGVDQDHPIESQIRLANEVMIDWIRKRDKRATNLGLIFIARTEDQAKILEWTRKLLSQKFEYSEVLQNLQIRVLFQEPGRQELKEYEVTKPGKE